MMSDVLPTMKSILKIVVASEDDVPAYCQECRFSDRDFFGEWLCVNSRGLDFPRAKPDWCPIIVQGSNDELLFALAKVREKVRN